MEQTLYEFDVLVVEDHDSNLDVTVKMLERLGCRVDQAKDGHQALEAVGRTKFDIIFMDCQLPVMDGYEATRRIREREAKGGEHTNIIAITADAMQYQVEKCKNAGMDDCLFKPISYQDYERMLDLYGKNLS